MNSDKRPAKTVGYRIPRLEKDWKYYLGITLFVFSWLTFGFAFVAPFLPVSAAIAAVIAAAFIIAGEVTFWASVALLGKPFMQFLKAKLLEFLHSRRPAELRRVSKQRHYVGLALFLGSFLSYYLAMAIPFIGLPREQMLAGIIVILIVGQATFFISLFVLGGEFWAKLKKLFQWPGYTLT